MTRLVQISDLHFGTVDPDLLEPLSQAIGEAAPDLVIMAGDFVQRARASQFSDAAEFMAGLGRPWLGVPGNHDIPLFNLPLRLIDPFRAYKRWIDTDLQPRASLAGVQVVGLNTADPHSHQRGIVSPEEIERIGEAIRAADGSLVVIVAHHPFHQSPDVEKKLMLGAADALEHWAQCGPHVIMSGHLHQWLVEPFARRKGANMTLQLHCGTGLSTRRRGNPNDFAIVDCDAEGVAVTRMVAEGGRFVEAAAVRYDMGEAGWTRSGDRIER
ncbi:metallophosphoesterase [Roseobacter sp. HKCCA0434]|uniref:metallophosphoesterase family protein n=1 Tax=Roseobacter sp. HKCCA0434 TaxID=3079297 RepID=UPI00290595DD|nr:metallophosphoesterase [Roseobacter sp. HKCCA0434]